MNTKKIIHVGLIICLSSCINTGKENETNTSKDKLFGTWKVVKTIYTEPYEYINNNDSDACWNQEITFSEKGIFSMSKCFSQDSCSNPTYSFTREKTILFFENDSLFINQLGIIDDSLSVIETNCDVPFKYIYMIKNSTIIIGKDNYHWY